MPSHGTRTHLLGPQGAAFPCSPGEEQVGPAPPSPVTSSCLCPHGPPPPCRICSARVYCLPTSTGAQALSHGVSDIFCCIQCSDRTLSKVGARQILAAFKWFMMTTGHTVVTCSKASIT